MIPMPIDQWEFWLVPGNGYHMRWKNQEHPTAMMNTSFTTAFYGLDYAIYQDKDGLVKFEQPHLSTPTVKQYRTIKLYDLLANYFCLYYQISWNYEQFRNASVDALRREVQMLRYIDVIRSYRYEYEIHYGLSFPAFHWTTQQLWFLAEGGMCICGKTRKYHNGEVRSLIDPHEFVCDFTFGVSEETAQDLTDNFKIPKSYNVELP